jgi:hypothetical protein
MAASWAPTPVRSDGLGGQEAGLHGVVELAQAGALLRAVRHHLVRHGHHLGIQLALVGAVGAQGHDRRPGLQHARNDQRRAGGRRRDHQVRSRPGVRDGRDGAYRDPRQGLHLGGVGLRGLAPRRPDAHLPERSDPAGQAQLKATLDARAEDRDHKGTGRCEELDGESPGRGGSQVRQVSVVGQDGQGESGDGVEDQHQARAGGEAPRGVPVEPGGHLEGEDRRPLEVGALHVDLTLHLEEIHSEGRGDEGLFPCQRGEGSPRALHGRGVVHHGADGRFVEDAESGSGDRHGLASGRAPLLQPRLG